jgi:hypothetical protein
MEHWTLLVVLILCLPVVAQVLQPPPLDESTHQALREMRDKVVKSLNTGDIDAVLVHLHPNFVFTAMNGEVCRGRDALKPYFQRMMKDPGHIVESLSVNPTVDHLTDLYGGTAGVAYGSSVDHYKLVGGEDFAINARWTATLVKENGNWQIASFQSSANIFDNPLINKAKTSLYLVGGGGILAGVVLGWVLGRRRGKPAA